MSAQIKIDKVGVPSERNTGVPLAAVTSADPANPKVDKLTVGSTSAMSSNNMPKGRRV